MFRFFVLLVLAHTATAGELWPGFDPAAIPLAIYDGEVTRLYRHSSPPDGFRKAGDHHVFDGRHPAVTANSSAKIGGIETATIVTPDADAGLIAHELFHVHQRHRHPRWSANEADLFTYPLDDARLLALRRLEREALRRALHGERSASACWARAALALRRERFAAAPESVAAYDRGTELNEGLATYVGHRALGTRDETLVEAPAPAAQAVREQSYESGLWLARLLDRFAPRWREQLESGDATPLDELLSAALPKGGASCSFTGIERAQATRDAELDAARITKARGEARSEFLGTKGWTVVVETASPFFPAGFDPLNVQVAGVGEVLHGRFVKLSGDRGTLEVLGRATLTTAAGAHPLFNGVRRAIVTGLAAEPRIVERDGVVTLHGAGITAELRNATVERGRGRITLRIPQ